MEDVCMSKDNLSTQPVTSSLTGLLLRLFWMIAGNLAIALSAVLILQGGGPIPLLPDLIYWVAVPLMIVSRYADVRYFNGTNGYGERATMQDWRRYSVKVVIVAIVLWIAAHSLAGVVAK